MERQENLIWSRTNHSSPMGCASRRISRSFTSARPERHTIRKLQEKFASTTSTARSSGTPNSSYLRPGMTTLVWPMEFVPTPTEIFGLESGKAQTEQVPPRSEERRVGKE